MDEKTPLFYRDNWDVDVGMWSRGDDGRGNAGVFHLVRDNAWTLVSAGFDGLLREVPAGRVLAGIQGCQERSGPRRGCFWWKREDGRLGDTNSGFFTGMALIALRFEFASQLLPSDLALLDTILRDSRPWFHGETTPLDEGRMRYPNRTLGDLACRWLLMELFDERNDPETEEALARGLAYYRDSPWGWGEHMSDLYGKVCQGQLTALLAYARRMPPETVGLCESLLRDTMAIDEAYAGGPRVPTIRCYALDKTPLDHMPGVYRPWRSLTVPWSAERRSRSHMIMASVAWRHGLHERFTVPAARAERVEVPCYGGTRALEGEAVAELAFAQDGARHWEHRYGWPDGARPRRVAGLWALRMGSAGAALPAACAEDADWLLRAADGPPLRLAPWAAGPWGSAGD
jgi:hypothetical protein